MLTKDEIEANMTLGQAITEALDEMPAEWYELVYVQGQDGLPQPLIWPMRLNLTRQGNFVQVKGGPIQSYSHRIDH